MADYKGYLDSLTLTPQPQGSLGGGLGWKVHLQLRDGQQSIPVDTTTTDIIAVSLLLTALQDGRGNRRWPVEVTTDVKTPTSTVIQRVRIIDDRNCGTFDELPDNTPVIPLTPTAFSGEKKWGYFFLLGSDCHEYKGISLDVYLTIEAAWREGGYVVLTFGGGDLIVSAVRR